MNTGVRALVTGAAGFIGAHLCRYLLETGWQVRAFDIHESNAPYRYRIDYRVQDLRDPAALEQALENIDVVFHLASVHLDVHASHAEFESVNVRAVEHLVRSCARAKISRLVHVSSVGVYGHVAAPPAMENALLNPENDYERTKLAGEEAARRAAGECGLDLVILRPSWVYGRGCPRTEKLLSALSKRQFFYIGSGGNLRHPLYIEDFLLALVKAASVSEAAGKTYNIAGPRWMTVKEMVGTFATGANLPQPLLRLPRWLGFSLGFAAEQVSAITGMHAPISRRTLAFFENDNAFDTSAARRDLEFEARTELLDGVRMIVGEAQPHATLTNLRLSKS